MASYSGPGKAWWFWILLPSEGVAGGPRILSPLYATAKAARAGLNDVGLERGPRHRHHRREVRVLEGHRPPHREGRRVSPLIL